MNKWTAVNKWTAAEFSVHLEICEHDINAIRKDSHLVEPEDIKVLHRDSSLTMISVEGGNPRMLRARMDSLFMNLSIANALGYQTREEKERYRDAKCSFFALQREHGIFYWDDDL